MSHLRTSRLVPTAQRYAVRWRTEAAIGWQIDPREASTMATDAEAIESTAAGRQDDALLLDDLAVVSDLQDQGHRGMARVRPRARRP